MPPNDTIKRQRQVLKIKVEDLARSMGTTDGAYWDIEAYPNEIYTVTPIAEVRRLCSALSLSFTSLCDAIYAEYLSVEKRVPSIAMRYEGPDNPVRGKRLQMGLSAEKLADLIGYEVIAIERIEDDISKLEERHLEFCFELASHLEMPWQQLLGI